MLSVVLAVMMVMSMSVTAFAMEYDPDSLTTIKFKLASSQVSTFAATEHPTQSVKGYKLLNLSTSLKADDDCAGDHTSACYNYAYTINDKYEDILLDVASSHAGSTVAALDLVNWLSGLSKEEAQLWADDVYREIADAGIDADADAIDVSNSATISVEKGYWLFADITSYGSNDDVVNSLVLLATKGDEDLTVTPKQDVPTLVKKVSNTEDSGWSDTISATMQDTVYFKLTSTLTKYLGNYTEYPVAIMDTMSEGLVGNDDVKVLLVDSHGDAIDITADCGIDTNGTDVVVEIADLIDLGAEAEGELVVTYSATLTEDAEIGRVTTANTNTAYMAYNANPYATYANAVIVNTASDLVYVYTYGIEITKVDGNDNSTTLADAEFVIYRETDSGVEYAVFNSDGTISSWEESSIVSGTEIYPEGSVLTSGDDGIITMLGLGDGEYFVRETDAPSGYNKLNEDFELVIESTTTESAITDLGLDVTYSGNTDSYDGNTTTGMFEFNIGNYAGGELPGTGGNDALYLTLIGSIIFIGATVLLITKKRTSIIG